VELLSCVAGFSPLFLNYLKEASAGGIMVLKVSLIEFLSFSFGLLRLLLAPKLFGAFPLVVYFCYL
jgi:hypothetical protein